ncbi:MAG: response regulator [Polyangiaceae bacterium]|nr:response regulator [Polyangiaceae bacterium]
MMDVEQPTSLSGSSDPKAEFVSSIGRRLAVLRGALNELQARPESAKRRDDVLRRLHALGAASRVLGFDAAADALGHAEASLQHAAAASGASAGSLSNVAVALDRVPQLVWGAPADSSGAPQEADAVRHTFPISVVVFGGEALGKTLAAAQVSDDLDHERGDHPAQVVSLARSMGPDVIVVDADRDGAQELVDQLQADDRVDPFALVVVGDFPAPEAAAAFLSRGAVRALPKPVSPDTLMRAVSSVARRPSEIRAREPIGDVTMEELASRVAAEVRRGLVSGVEPAGLSATVPFGEGVDVMAAVWSAVARVREITTLRSGGTVRFESGGPEGAIPFAPWGGERRAGERQDGARASDRVRLEGRLAVVADDDPAVVWFLSGMLKAAGMEVIEAHDGARALEHCLIQWPDVVISDVLMPKLDGFALCREIKRDVAIRDVPVVLLSWKEDLLQRVRELGARADGYLKKEAASATVLERLREVVRPRARVEARLAAGGVVRGRLDGLTPRLILELASARHRDCRVSFRDAAFLYEVELRGGRPVQITRTSTDGGFSRGASAVMALLGVSAGRFVVTPDTTPCRDAINQSLQAWLAPHIIRARRLTEIVTRDLERIDQLEIDVEAMQAYLTSIPEPERGRIERLVAGEAPRVLLAELPSERDRLEGLLLDVARRGAITSVVREGAIVDLGAAPEPRSAAPEPRPHVPEAEQPSPAPAQFTLDLSPSASESALSVAPSTHVSADWPLDPSMTPGAESSSSAFPPETGTFPGMGPPSAERGAGIAAPVIVRAAEPLDDASGAPSVELPPAESSTDDAVASEVEASKQAAPAAASPSPTIEPSPAVAEPRRGEARTLVSAGPEIRKIVMPKAEAPEPRAAREESPPSEQLAREEPLAEAGGNAEPEAGEEPVLLPSTKRIAFPRRADDEPSAPAPEAEADVDADLASEQDAPESEPAPKVSASRKPAAGRFAGWAGTARVLAVMGIAGGASFGVVTWVRGLASPGAESAPAEASGEAAPAAPPTAPAAAPKGASALAGGKPAKIETLPLPPGTDVSDGKGLLEVDIAGKDAIYVGGTFVGRGPMRRIQLDPGTHEVKLRTPGEESTHAVEISGGVRTRLSLTGP